MKQPILVVDDNPANATLLTFLLEAEGYDVRSVSDAHEALAQLESFEPRLILMDIQLPEVSGLQVTKWLKQDNGLKHIPVVAVTAFAMKGDEEKIREGGCEAYLAKPISVMSFLQTVERFLA